MINSVSNDNNPMGYVYISEAFMDSNIRNIDTKHDKSIDLFYVTFDANLQDFDVENRNHRYYDAGNIMECLKSEKIQTLLRSNALYGESDHPMPTKEGEKLSPERIQEVPTEKRAFKILNPHLTGNVMQSRIQSTQYAAGRDYGKEVLAGWKPGFSVRAIANMVSKNGKPYVMVKRLITWDSVPYQSHRVAVATSSPNLTVNTVTESVHDVIETAKDKINDIIVPLKEILLDVGRRDVNANMILESFDLPMSNLCGFDSSRRHVIIKDENNYVYANINPDTVKRVNDFYNSFNL